MPYGSNLVSDCLTSSVYVLAYHRNEQLIQAGQAATNSSGRVFADVDGRDHRSGAHTKPSDESSHIQRGDLAGRSGLHHLYQRAKVSSVSEEETSLEAIPLSVAAASSQ